MKRFLAFLISFLMFCFVATIAADIAQSNLHIAPAIGVIVVLMIAIFAPRAKSMDAVAAVEVSRWVDYIMKRFWKDNAFLKTFYSDDKFVLGGKTVVLPQPGAKPTVTKNPTSFPLTAAQRTDTTISYDLDWYVTAPTHITDAEKQEISYDKMDSVLGDHLSVQSERAADELLIKMLDLIPQANILYTTGGASATAAAAAVTGQTGNRYILHPKDLKRCGLKLNLANIPKEGRYAVLESNCLDQMTDVMTDAQWNMFKEHYDPATGQIGRLFGFDIFDRSSVAIAAAALNGSSQLAVDAYGASVGATDLVANLIYHKGSVARAMGEIKFFESKDNPEYAGDIYNAGLRFGGRRRYTNADGVIALCQGTPS